MVFESVYRTTDGTVKSGACTLGVVILTPGSAVASVLVTDGGAGGTPKLTLQAATNGSSVVALVNMHIVTDVYVNLTGTGASVTCLVGESNASFV